MRISEAMTRVETDIGDRAGKNRSFAVGETVDLESGSRKVCDRCSDVRMQRAVRVLKHILQHADARSSSVARSWGGLLCARPRSRPARGPATAFSTVDLPEPDSPTIPKVSPRGDLEGDLLHRHDAPEPAAESHGQILDRDGRCDGHDIHAESRATTLSSALGRSSSGAAATRARV